MRDRSPERRLPSCVIAALLSALDSSTRLPRRVSGVSGAALVQLSSAHSPSPRQHAALSARNPPAACIFKWPSLLQVHLRPSSVRPPPLVRTRCTLD
ncbi:hypothetical protein K466DRAFT_592851 [Polyporus arcularius HHB13444]|uniref:Uncharacterized protein n=1 Tax=Polyporus arcularius HHB13444 TaxID=1314778 RepID=A0A5C3NNP3_9APHY|nr:hypothetical protein K466DRAFT_592851 [Polyporus arcularius HHB13444]